MIKLVWNNTIGRGDFEQGADDKYYLEEDGLETMILYSLFTDGRKPGGRSPSGRGWWGDSYMEDVSETGCRLWRATDRGVLTNANIEIARKSAEDALQWMVGIGMASAVEVSAERTKRDTLDIAVGVFRPDGTRWSGRWEAQLRALD